VRRQTGRVEHKTDGPTNTQRLSRIQDRLSVVKADNKRENGFGFVGLLDLDTTDLNKV
jgi:hypothetical protein